METKAQRLVTRPHSWLLLVTAGKQQSYALKPRLWHIKSGLFLPYHGAFFLRDLKIHFFSSDPVQDRGPWMSTKCDVFISVGKRP